MLVSPRPPYVLNPSDPKAIASRILGLIGGQDHGIIESTARRLQVSEVSLRISIDAIEPHPTVQVIMAVVREYGVDPTWLLTGEYDASSHRQAVDDEASFTRSDLARLIARSQGAEQPSAEPGPDLRLEA